MDQRSKTFVLLRRVVEAQTASVRASPLMSMAETVAWIAIRDSIYCDAVRSYQVHEIEEQARELGVILGEPRFIEAVLWVSMSQDANKNGMMSFGEAQSELFDTAQTGAIVGLGQMSGSNWKDIDKRDWIGARIIYTDVGDTLAPFASEDGLSGPTWGLVRFYRDDVMKLWPPQETRADDAASDRAPVRYRRGDLLRAGPTGPGPAKWVPVLITYFDTLMRSEGPGLDGTTLDRMTREFASICRNKGLPPPSRSRIAEYRERYRNSDCLDSRPESSGSNSG